MEGFQEFSFSSCNPIAFISDVVSEIFKVFQGDVLLSDILLELCLLDGSGVVTDGQLLALINFRIPFSFWKSSSFSIIIYTEINSATSPDEGALSNLLIFWINVPIKIATLCLITVRGALYTRVVNNSFIISRIPPVRPFSSCKMTKTCLNNTTVLLV